MIPKIEQSLLIQQPKNTTSSSIPTSTTFLGPNLEGPRQGICCILTTRENWNERIIRNLNRIEIALDEEIPNFPIQEKIDKIGQFIEKKLDRLGIFNQWLDSNGHGKWYQQLATFLAKLPMRAVRNIVRLLYNIVKSALFAAVHPLKALNNLAKLLVNLIHELTKPATWSKIGAGIIGASLGHALVTGNPLSVIGLGVGAAMVIGGLSVGALKAAVQEEQGKRLQAVANAVWGQIKQLPEPALTGFVMGLITGGIERAIQKSALSKPKNYTVSDPQEAQKYADQFIKDHNLPEYTHVELDPSGNIIIHWDRYFYHEGPKGVTVSVSRAELILQPNLPPIINAYGTENIPYLPGIDFKWTYPSGPEVLVGSETIAIHNTSGGVGTLLAQALPGLGTTKK